MLFCCYGERFSCFNVNFMVFNMKSEQPIYISKAGVRSFGNEYRIYNNRLELECKFLFQTFIIPLEELISIDIFKPPVIRTVFWALKLDLADFYRHIGIEREKGYMKKLRFIPENPDEFIATVNELITKETN